MNTEGETRLETEAEELAFDAHEFDGLREEAASIAQTWARRADEFVRQNPWLCLGIAVAAGCTIAWAISRNGSEEEEDP